MLPFSLISVTVDFLSSSEPFYEVQNFFVICTFVLSRSYDLGHITQNELALLRPTWAIWSPLKQRVALVKQPSGKGVAYFIFTHRGHQIPDGNQ